MAPMKPHEISAALKLARVTQASIARKLGLTPGTISGVINNSNRKSKRVRREVAHALGRPYKAVWGRIA